MNSATSGPSSAERVRRHRARKKLEAQQLDELTFVRRDFALFLDPNRLPQKAGCRANRMRALALKELADNGLDHGANVTLEQIDRNTWSVEDDGPGMDAARIACLFAVDRPLTSTKLLRRPTRGAVGNGLRVVTGAAIASGGALWVESRGRRFEIKVDLATGRTEAVEVGCNAPAKLGTKVTTRESGCNAPTKLGTKVTIKFGPALVETVDDGDLARHALRFPGPACAPMRSHLGWYDAGAWLELVQAAPAGTTVAQLLDHMGISSTDQRAAVDIAFAKLAKLELPPEPKLLTRGAGGLEGADYAKLEDTGFVLVEAWAKAEARMPKNHGSARLVVFINRTPVLVDGGIINSGGGMFIDAGGSYRFLEKVPTTARYYVELSITAPVVPIINDGKTPDLSRFKIEGAVSAAMRAAEKRLEKPPSQKGAIKDAAWEVMEEAYLKASDHGRLPANARQIMYAARPMIADLIGGEPVKDK